MSEKGSLCFRLILSCAVRKPKGVHVSREILTCSRMLCSNAMEEKIKILEALSLECLSGRKTDIYMHLNME